MQLLVFVTGLLAATAQAADLCAASAPDCRGVLRCCRNIAQNRCCIFGGREFESRSIRLTLPARGSAQAWSGNQCFGAANVFTALRSGTTCHAWRRRQSARWSIGRPLVKPRQEEDTPEPDPENEPLPAEPEPGTEPPVRRDASAASPAPADQCVEADLVITEDGRELSVAEARAAGLV